MKDKTAITQQHVKAAIKSMPSDFALSSARNHLKKALEELEKVNSKRNKRSILQKTIADEWQAKIAEIDNPLSPKDALKAIEDMIAIEQAKQKKQTKSTNDETLLD